MFILIILNQLYIIKYQDDFQITSELHHPSFQRQTSLQLPRYLPTYLGTTTLPPPIAIDYSQ